MTNWKQKNDRRKAARKAAQEAKVPRAKMLEARRLRRHYGGAFGTEDKADRALMAVGTLGSGAAPDLGVEQEISPETP